MIKKRYVVFFITIVAVFCLGCAQNRIHPLGDMSYPRKPANEEIELYLGKVSRPHVEIAVVDSHVYEAKDDATKERQTDELKNVARKVGADAVHEIRLLYKKARGFVPDPRVPIPAWKQGENKLYFLRGTAIKFTPEEEMLEEDSSTSTTE